MVNTFAIVTGGGLNVNGAGGITIDDKFTNLAGTGVATFSLTDGQSQTFRPRQGAGGLSVHTIGAVIQPGGRMMDIVPQQEKLIVEAQMSPLDIDRLHVGPQAELRFSSFKTRETPKIDGTLVKVSADRLMDEQDKQPYYLARIAVTPEGLAALARYKLELVPGMPCEVLINTGSRTALKYLFDPLRNAMARSFKED